MNPFKAIMGASETVQTQVQNVPQMNLNAGFGGILGRAQQLAGILQNPQTLVQRYFPDAPAEISGNPEQLLGWMQQTGKVSPQMVQTVMQIVGRK